MKKQLQKLELVVTTREPTRLAISTCAINQAICLLSVYADLVETTVED